VKETDRGCFSHKATALSLPCAYPRQGLLVLPLRCAKSATPTAINVIGIHMACQLKKYEVIAVMLLGIKYERVSTLDYYSDQKKSAI
jgi:hypothetical protein